MSRQEKDSTEMPDSPLSLKQKILIAAVEGAKADTTKKFTMEDLAVWAWERDRVAWGLRGYEKDYPDLDKLRKDMGARGADQKGVVQLGWVERVEPRVYRLTPAGLAEYATINNATGNGRGELQEKAGRELGSEISRILEHRISNFLILYLRSRPDHLGDRTNGVWIICGRTLETRAGLASPFALLAGTAAETRRYRHPCGHRSDPLVFERQGSRTRFRQFPIGNVVNRRTEWLWPARTGQTVEGTPAVRGRTRPPYSVAADRAMLDRER